MSETHPPREFIIRIATDTDVPAIERLIPLSARALQAPYYSVAQINAALGPVFAVDRQLIADGTYFVVEASGQIVGCGGWSRRLAAYGGGHAKAGETIGELDPRRDAARIRAFFVHPDFARRGIGRMLLRECEEALRLTGFTEAMMVATLAGEPLYASAGYEVIERYDIEVPAGEKLPAVRMRKRFGPAKAGSRDN
jgi:predicted N-acetyltransferase YhbS